MAIDTHVQTVFVLKSSGYKMIKVEVPLTEPNKKVVMPFSWTSAIYNVLSRMFK